MANKFIRYLTQGFTGGVLRPKGTMANWQHATRLFVDNTYRLAPRSKFLFYVRFEIDRTAVKSQVFQNNHVDEVGYLVKTADMPKYTIDSVVKNQYNRKKLIYKSLNYEPVNITFHDDTNGIINALWALYYGYYSADRNLPAEAFGDIKYRPVNDPRSNFRYGLDNNKSVDFFKSISLYTMSRRRFNGYTLINPRIKSWNHSQGDYAATDFMDHQMTVEYESVQYSQGTVSRGTPKGFATLYYDQTPSPLSVAGGGVATLTGEGGVLDGLEQVFGSVGNGSAFGSVGGFLGTAISAINTAKNFKNLSKDQLKSEAIGILTNPAAITGAAKTIGGVLGSVIPKSQSNSNTTVASAKQVVGGEGE